MTQIRLKKGRKGEEEGNEHTQKDLATQEKQTRESWVENRSEVWRERMQEREGVNSTGSLRNDEPETVVRFAQTKYDDRWERDWEMEMVSMRHKRREDHRFVRVYSAFAAFLLSFNSGGSNRRTLTDLFSRWQIRSHQEAPRQIHHTKQNFAERITLA